VKSVIKKTCPEPVEGKRKQKTAFSLVEMLVVLAIIAMLVVLAIPGINAMQKSFNSTGAEGMISAALSTARTLAIKNGHYAGVRFQKAGNALQSDQYMIFIAYGGRDQTNWVCGFVAVEGYKPIKLPENINVIDKIRRRERTSQVCGNPFHEDPLVETDLSDNVNITDTSTFSIVFSPTGRLVTQEVRCRRKDNNNNETIFNDPPTGMFLEDNHDDSGIGVENSRREFYIYDKEKFEKMTTSSQKIIYLDGLKPVYVNPYTGELIKN